MAAFDATLMDLARSSHLPPVFLYLFILLAALVALFVLFNVIACSFTGGQSCFTYWRRRRAYQNMDLE